MVFPVSAYIVLSNHLLPCRADLNKHDGILSLPSDERNHTVASCTIFLQREMSAFACGAFALCRVVKKL